MTPASVEIRTRSLDCDDPRYVYIVDAENLSVARNGDYQVGRRQKSWTALSFNPNPSFGREPRDKGP